LLTGKYKKGQSAPKGSRLAEKKNLAERYLHHTNLEKVERLEHFAKERGHTLLELAFSWLLARPAVASVIAGATKPEQVEKNAESANWHVSAEELAEIDRITGKG
jgi:aryl-alcohol dehydrogenase-like predicted oxidoreductase